MFKEERDDYQFNWSMLGNVAVGRPNLGPVMDLTVYRLMQFTLRDALIKEFDTATADRLFFDAGKQAGIHFCRKLVNKENDFAAFVQEVQDLLSKLKIGIMRMEKADLENLHFTLTVAEDLDCSGLPVSDETICTYDEGFISGLLLEYTGKPFDVKEIDCWCSGDRVCRFDARPSA